MKSSARRLVIALFVVFLHYAAQIAAWTEEEERYCDGWSRWQPVSAALGITVLAVAAVAADQVVRRLRRPWLKRVFDHLFLVALTSGLLAAFPAVWQTYPRLTGGIWIAALAIIVGSFVWQRSPLVRVAAVFCLIFSPIMPILGVQTFFWSTWAERPDPLAAMRQPFSPGTRAGSVAVAPGTSAGAKRADVFLFVFDEWSYLRSTGGGPPLGRLANVRKLCDKSVVFSQCVSPHRETMQSLPRLIYQTDRRLAIRRGRTYLEDAHSSPPTQECPSLFTLARQSGYATGLLGWYHPYRHMLGDQVDCCRVYSTAFHDAPLSRQAVARLAQNAAFWSDPISRQFGPLLLERIDAKRWYAMNVRYREDMLRLVAEAPRRSFLLFHVPLPHAPLVFDADGAYHGPGVPTSDRDGYLRQLQCLDNLVGRIVATLEAAGRLDPALVILTSDHGWRFDPDAAIREVKDWDRRIPLIVKLPGQREGQVVDRPFCTNRLQPLVEAVLRGENDVPKLRRELDACLAPALVPGVTAMNPAQVPGLNE